MKSYKLIKEYPGSSSLGTIFHIGGFAGDVSKYPEFFEEVVENDYEIVSYWSPRIGDTKYLYYEGHEDWDNINKSQCHSIHSVKRLSDGEVFTVGDLIKTPYTDCTRIAGFENPEGREYFIEILTKCSTEWVTGFTRLLNLEKVKNPIFLTHDGKDIFNGDKVWYVNRQDFYKSYFIASKTQSFFSDRMAYFLTRQDAEDYIEKNKILFTTEDGVGITEGDKYYFVDTDFSIQTMKAHRSSGKYSERKYFSTVEEAHEYVMQNVKALSIKDFWEITCMSTSNFNKSIYMKDLVKKTLGIK